MSDTRKAGDMPAPPPAVGTPGANAGTSGLPADLQGRNTPATASGGPAGPGSPSAKGGNTTATSPSLSGAPTNDAEPGGGTGGETPADTARGRA